MEGKGVPQIGGSGRNGCEVSLLKLRGVGLKCSAVLITRIFHRTQVNSSRSVCLRSKCRVS
jgi:hypothetical protein